MKRRDRSTLDEKGLITSQRWELLDRISRWLDVPMAVLALLWVVLLIIDYTVPLSDAWKERVWLLDTAIWLSFAAHFLLEFFIAPDKIAYLRSHWLTALSVALPFLRVVRLFRALLAFRTLSLLRVVLGANRATRSVGLFFSEHGFQYVLALVTIFALAGAAGVYGVERAVPGSSFDSFGTALWWSATLLTTINVGIEPVTVEGRAIAVLLRIVALSLFGYVTGSVASYFVRRRAEAKKAVTRRQPKRRITRRHAAD